MLTIAETPVDAPEARLLMAELSRELAWITGLDGRARFHPADVQEAGNAFLVAYLDGEPWDCGALRRLWADTGEIKRVYARPNRAGWAAGFPQPRRKGPLPLGTAACCWKPGGRTPGQWHSICGMTMRPAKPTGPMRAGGTSAAWRSA